MENTCKSCGTPLEENACFCPNCGANVGSVAAAPARAKNDLPDTLGKVLKFVLIGLVVISLTLAIFDFFGFIKTSVTLSYGDMKKSTDVKISELSDDKTVGNYFVVVDVGNVACGIVMVLATAVGTFGFLKSFGVCAALDKVWKSQKPNKEYNFVAFWGMIATAFQILCYWLVSSNNFSGSVSLSVAPPWYAWVALVLFVGAFVVGKIAAPSKKD